MCWKPQVSPAPRKSVGWAEERLPLGWLSWEQLLVPSKQRPLAMSPPSLPGAPNTQTQMLPPPNNWKTRGVAPKSRCLCSSYPRLWVGERQGVWGPAGSTAPWWHFSLTFTPGATAHFSLTDPKFFLLTSHPQAEALLHPGGEDSLIKVFRNAGGWRLGRGGV